MLLPWDSEGTLPLLTPGPLWGPGTVSPPKNETDESTTTMDKGNNGKNYYSFFYQGHILPS